MIYPVMHSFLKGFNFRRGIVEKISKSERGDLI